MKDFGVTIVAANMSSPQRIRRMRPGWGHLFFSDCLQLAKPRVTGLSLLSTAVGFLLAFSGDLLAGRFLGTLFFTLLAAVGGSVLNQYLDRDTDSLMSRTARRPLPAGRLSPAGALLAGIALSAAGIASLGVWINPLASLLTGLTLLIYLGAYTPLKRKTVLSTWVGAVAGALPPLIGWTAAGGALDVRGFSLALILYFWQIPHFLAIAWIQRRQYATAGLRVLTTVDPAGTRTGRQVMLHSCLLLASSLLPVWIALSGLSYLAAAALLGLAFTASALYFLLSPTDGRALLLLKASVVYLPCLLLSMCLDRLW